MINGIVEVVLLWGSGDISGLRIHNSVDLITKTKEPKVTTPKIIMALEIDQSLVDQNSKTGEQTNGQ